MKITTKGGDAGETSLGSGVRVPKDDVRISLVGTVDECQAHAGAARALAQRDNKSFIAEKLIFIEKALGALMGHLTMYPGCECPPIAPLDETIAEAELHSDAFAFVLPGESELTAALHIARTVSRRAERTAIPLIRQGDISKEASRYLNRLSDYFYALVIINKK